MSVYDEESLTEIQWSRIRFNLEQLHVDDFKSVTEVRKRLTEGVRKTPFKHPTVKAAIEQWGTAEQKTRWKELWKELTHE